MSISLVTKTIRFITVKIGPNEVIVIVEKGRDRGRDSLKRRTFEEVQY